jgi:hypothetical protein
MESSINIFIYTLNKKKDKKYSFNNKILKKKKNYFKFNINFNK